MASEPTRDGKAAHPFVRDIEPYFYGRPITYVDVGAHHGSILLELLASSVRVREAHLIEPNPASFRTLQATAAEITDVNQVSCHNVAISSAPGVLTMRDEGTMTHVAPPHAASETTATAGGPYFEINSTTLDELARNNEIGQINLLKVDVEGHELAVLEGAKELLATESIDVIYIEAGMNPDAKQHAYYRSIEDALQSHGYRVSRFYEQRHEWQVDSPLLRRANLAFLSTSFAANNPSKLSRELFTLRKRDDENAKRAAELEARAAELGTKAQALEAAATQLTEQRDAAVRRADDDAAKRQESEQQLAAARRERDAFVSYADELEVRFTRVLRSSSWRVTGPVRVAIRRLRSMLGRPASGPQRLPARPSGKSRVPATRASSGQGDVVDEVMAKLKRSEFARVYELQRQLEPQLATDDGFLAHSFATVALAKKSSTFAFGAQAADAAFARYGDRRGDLVTVYGAAGYRRFVSDAAACYTRVGRYADARALLDAEIAHGTAELLPVRAEISWIHDPEQAVRDLDAHLARARSGGKGRGDALLRAHVVHNVLGTPADEPTGELAERGGEFRLVEAIRALSDGRPREYRKLVNGFFGDQGLDRPFVPSDDPFSFKELGVQGDVQHRADGPLVSVIMTTHNAELTLRYAVRSILDQSHRNLELLVIDDCSTDKTVELLTELAADDDRIRVLRNEQNTGTYAARNLAMEQANGTYITFHDSDDWAHPQRIAVHLDAMEADPGLVATRSMWLRVDPQGTIDFRRWHKRVAHPNPASIFIRSDLIDSVGYFDTVRFGADSEYWFRTIRVCGRAAVSGLPACLGLGLHHPASLTQGGVGARDVEDYSAIRAAYQYSWLEWQARHPAEELHLEAALTDRVFWAPPDMLSRPAPANERLASLARTYPGQQGEPSSPPFVFAISLASKKAAADWRRTEMLLGRTLRSVLNQSDGRWRVVICGHDRPRLAELDDPRVRFMVADIEAPSDPKRFRKDKTWKRRLIGSALRDLGGGYFCPLDADDLVHKDVVQHVLADDNRRGYNIATGYVEDFANGLMAPVPGAWSAPFDRVCGSSAVLYFTPDELPRDGRLDPELYFNLFQAHAYWPIVAEECGRPLATIPFPGAVYVVNHNQNLSFGLQRGGDRTANIISSIERHAVASAADVLVDSFGQEASAHSEHAA